MNTTRSRGRPAYPDALTRAEWRVAEGVRHGMTNRAIAERLGVSSDAVKFHVANILGKLSMARRSELRRWNGVRADSNLAQEVPQGMGLLNSALGPLGQIARSVKNIEAAEAWYRDVLSLPHLYTFGTLAFFDCGGTRLMLNQDGGDTASILYFRVANIRTTYQQLEDRGAMFVAAPHMIHRHANGVEEWMAFFNDNEGRPLAIMAQLASNEENSDE